MNSMIGVTPARLYVLRSVILAALILTSLTPALWAQGAKPKGKLGGSTLPQGAAKGPGKCDPNVEICTHEEGHQDPPINARLSYAEPDASHIDYDQEMLVSCPTAFWSKFTFKAITDGTWYYRVLSSNLTTKKALSPYYDVKFNAQGEQQTVKFQWETKPMGENGAALIRFQLLAPYDPSKFKKASTSFEAQVELIKINGVNYVVHDEKRLRVVCSKDIKQ